MMTMIRIRNPVFVVLGLLSGAAVVSIYPLRLTGEFRHDDTVAHALAGLAISTGLSGLTVDRNDGILAVTAVAAVGWEILEGSWFECDELLSPACASKLRAWLVREDTVLDVCKVILGGFVGLRLTGRYD